MKYYGKSSEKIEKLLYSDTRTGLSEKEAKKRLLRFGKNIIFDTKKSQPSKVALKLIYDPISILLLLVALICFSAYNASYAFIVLAVWCINLTLTIISYYKAEKIFASLKSYGIPKMRVLRDGKVYMIDSRLIVPGDILLIEAGDIICADCKLISASELEVFEKDVCGTEDVVEKFVSDDADAVSLSDMHGMLFASSSVVYGYGVAIVVACSHNTEIVSMAGLLPITGEKTSELFSKVRKKCRTWSLFTIFASFLIFIIKLFFSPVGIFDAFVLIIALIGASMSESLLPLTQIAAARGMSNVAQIGDKNRVIIKNAGVLDKLHNINIFVATDELTEFEKIDILSRLKEKGIKLLLCAEESKAFALATQIGAPVFRNIAEIKKTKLSLGIVIIKDQDAGIELVESLQSNGYCVGVLTTKLHYIRMLSIADVAFTYGKFKYKTNEYSKTELETISGTQNQILCRVSDVICEENILSSYRAVGCAKGIFLAVSNAATYLITMQTTRFLLCVLSLIFKLTYINFLQILVGGMVLDLFTLFSFAFLSDRSFKKDRRHAIVDYKDSCISALILSLCVIACSSFPIVFNQNFISSDISTIAFLIMSFFPVIYIFFITHDRRKNGTANLLCLLSLVLFIFIIFFALFPSIANLLSLNLSLSAFIYLAVSLLLLLIIFQVKNRIHYKTNNSYHLY